MFKSKTLYPLLCTGSTQDGSLHDCKVVHGDVRHQLKTSFDVVKFSILTSIGSVHFCFKEWWVVIFIFIQILIEHSASKQWRP